MLLDDEARVGPERQVEAVAVACVGRGQADRARTGRDRDVESPRLVQHAHHRADFLVCRQVMEHIREPAPFLKMIIEAGSGRADPVIFVEVPNALYTLRELGIWDLIYEHFSYFTAQSLSRLFVEAGLIPVNIEENKIAIAIIPGARKDK